MGSNTRTQSVREREAQPLPVDLEVSCPRQAREVEEETTVAAAGGPLADPARHTHTHTRTYTHRQIDKEMCGLQ